MPRQGARDRRPVGSLCRLPEQASTCTGVDRDRGRLTEVFVKGGTRKMKPPPAGLFAGIDSGARDHQVCALSPTGKILGNRSFAHSGDGLSALLDWLDSLSHGELGEVYVAIEVPHGPVVETLLERGCKVFAINPKQLDRFRDRFSLAGAKDDRRDAYVLAHTLLTDMHCFRAIKLDDPLVIQVRQWSRIYEELMAERSRLTNRMREQLRRYFPQYLQLTNDVGESWILALWKVIPTPERALKTSPRKIEKLLKEHKIRRVTPSQVLSALRKTPLCVAPGAAQAAIAYIALLIDRLQLTNQQIAQCRKAIDTLVDQLTDSAEEGDDESKREQRDIDILRSIPGVGRIVLATLLGEASQALRDRDYSALRALSGTAPITIRSGQSWRVVMRRACHPRLRYACYHWARVAIQCDARSREIYQRARSRGKTHGTALRTVADHLLRVACSMLRSGTYYDPNHTQAAQAKQVIA